jgi:hypothetical protein
MSSTNEVNLLAILIHRLVASDTGNHYMLDIPCCISNSLRVAQ